jgi:hypothetical protein
MKKLLLSIGFLFILKLNFADVVIENKYSAAFEKAYQKHPEIPKGVLEAVAFCNTHFEHIQHASSKPESCSGIPNAYGVMGLTLDGENYFSNNLILVSKLSNYSVEEIISDPEKNILAYADAFSSVKKKLKINSNEPESIIPVLELLSELPQKTEGQLCIEYTTLWISPVFK